jgi:hypothetical protein
MKASCCAIEDPLACGFFLKYGGNTQYRFSVSGTLVKEYATIQGVDASYRDEWVIMYNILSEQGPWPTNVGGIFGLAFPALNCNPTCSDLAFETELFSMCMGDDKGLLLLGSDGVDESLSISPIIYVPIITGFKPTYYIVKLDSMAINEEIMSVKASSNTQMAIIDSGTTLLLLQHDLLRRKQENATNRRRNDAALCNDLSHYEKPLQFMRM